MPVDTEAGRCASTRTRTVNTVVEVAAAHPAVAAPSRGVVVWENGENHYKSLDSDSSVEGPSDAAEERSMKRAILTTALLLALPAGVAAQSAPDYYGACVDAVAGESDTTDNCTRRSVTVDVVATTIGSDLVVHGPNSGRQHPGGLTSKAVVRVRVIPVNDPPEAVDDEAETLEEEAAVVRRSGQRYGRGRGIRSGGVGGHGGSRCDGDRGRRCAVCAGSELVWDGALHLHDRRPEGLTATATVTMTVLPVNDAPEAVGVIPHQALEEGRAPVTVDMTLYFTDVDGDVLTYTAVSSDETAVTAMVADATLTLSAVVIGTATVTVTASDVGDGRWDDEDVGRRPVPVAEPVGPDGRGGLEQSHELLTASIRPRWGAPSYGAESLWQDQFHSYTYGAERDDAAVDARVGGGRGTGRCRSGSASTARPAIQAVRPSRRGPRRDVRNGIPSNSSGNRSDWPVSFPLSGGWAY